MKYDFLGVIVFGIVLLIGVAVIAAFITVGIFLIRALSRYVKSGNVRKEKSSIKKSLGEVLKQHREACKMTQEFVAEAIGVSRQAVSKWENGKCMPDYSIIQKLCDVIHVSLPELMDGEDAAKNREQKLIFGLLMGLSIVDIMAGIIMVGQKILQQQQDAIEPI